MKFECAFLYVAPGSDPAKDVARIEGKSVNMNVVGMSSYDQAEEIAKELAAKGCSAHRAVRRLWQRGHRPHPARCGAQGGRWRQ